MSVTDSINNLVIKIDSNLFLEKFGAPVEQLEELVKAKTVTVSKLMEIAPEGTVDPTLVYTILPCMLWRLY